MTEQELFQLLDGFAIQFEKYKNKELSALSADEIEKMKEMYSGVNQVYPNSLPRIFNNSCSSCVITAFEQFISIHDRLKNVYQINKPAEPEK